MIAVGIVWTALAVVAIGIVLLPLVWDVWSTPVAPLDDDRSAS